MRSGGRVGIRRSTAEQQARDLLERCGVEDAQSFTAGDVMELANLIADFDQLLAVATLYVDAFEGEGMSLVELMRLQDIEDIVKRHGRRGSGRAGRNLG
jgi:hypothetical protein